jgi:hypothetical protein
MPDNRKQALVIQNGILIDGSGMEAAANEAIVIEGNRIKSVGTLEKGKLADVIILDRDPVADISVLKGGAHVSAIIKDGKIVDLDTPPPSETMLAFSQAAPKKRSAA